jgi:hypothetical protein
MSQQMVSSPPIKQPRVSLNPTTPHRYPTGYHSPIRHQKWQKTMKKDVYVFLLSQAATLHISALHGLTKDVWPFHHAAYGVCYPHNPTQLSLSAAQPPIHNPK